MGLLGESWRGTRFLADDQMFAIDSVLPCCASQRREKRLSPYHSSYRQSSRRLWAQSSRGLRSQRRWRSITRLSNSWTPMGQAL
eukprot:s205_g14.t1